MPVRCVLVPAPPDEPAAAVGLLAAELAATSGARVAVVVDGTRPAAWAPAPARPGVFWLPAALLGLALDDPALVATAAAAAGCFARDVAVVVTDGPGAEAMRVGAAGAGGAVIDCRGAGTLTASGIAAHLAAIEADERARAGAVGVGPHPRPWPADERLDPTLLADGDRRNVVDRYRYWSEAAIVADLEARRNPFHVAIENWQHDLNIGTVVRNANAFNAAGVHIVGQRRWNRRGAMATDRYLTVTHHPTVADLTAWSEAEGLTMVGFDTGGTAVPLDAARLPERALLVFGQEGPGLSAELVAACAVVCEISQFGSTRSLNAGVASGIAMHAWCTRHRP